MDQKYAEMLHNKYAKLEEQEEKNALLRERMRLNKKRRFIPLWYTFGFGIITVLYAMIVTTKLALGGFAGALSYGVSVAMVGLVLVLSGIAIAAYLNKDFANIILIALYALLMCAGIEATGGSNAMTLSNFGAVLNEACEIIDFDYSVPLIVLGAGGILINIYDQKLKNDYEYLKLQEGFPNFNDRTVHAEYFPYAYLPPEERGNAVMEERPPIILEDDDFDAPATSADYTIDSIESLDSGEGI